jgi:hypothetical protein
VTNVYQMPSTSKVTQGFGASQSCAYCHGFAKIPPLIRGVSGNIHLNPDYEMVKRFHLAAEPVAGTVPAGGSQDFVLTVPAEDASLGDLLVNELMLLTSPNTATDIAVEFTNIQTSRFFQNAPVFNTLVFGNAQLNCCLPCCFLIQATNSTIVRVRNDEAVPVDITIVARGKRFLPKSDELRARMLMYWNQIPSYPYFLTLDDEEVSALAVGASIDVVMTVPGHGDFEVRWARCEVQGGATAEDIDVTVAEGIGREWQNVPMSLGAFIATPTISVAGFPGGLYRAASACHCPPFSQLFKRNTRVRHRFTNNGAGPADIRLTYAGCFHAVDECPPGRSMDRIRSLEPSIGPILIAEQDYCPPQSGEEYADEEWALPPTLQPVTAQSAPATAAQLAQIQQQQLPLQGLGAPPGWFYDPASGGWRRAR